MNKTKEPKTEHMQEELPEKEQAEVNNSQETEAASEHKKGKSKHHEQSKESNSRQRMQELESEYNQLKESNLRLLAEYDNYRKRSIREKAELIKTGGEAVLIGILSADWPLFRTTMKQLRSKKAWT